MNLSRLVPLLGLVALVCLGAVLYHSTTGHQTSMTMQERVFSSYDPLEHCVTPFDTILGYANGVPAFSNCISSFKSTYINYVNLMDPNDVGRRGDPSERTVAMLGMRHTSIDFYMRWLAWNRGLMPRLVENTDQFWKMNYFYNPAKPEQDWEAEYMANYMEATDLEERKFNAPRKADAILYNHEGESLPDGHIAVIVRVEDDVEAAGGKEKLLELKRERLQPRKVYVAEQNLRNTDWGGKNYTRVLRFQWRPVRVGKGHEGYFEDTDGLTMIGLVRIGKPKPLRHPANPYEDTMNKEEEGDL